MKSVIEKLAEIEETAEAIVEHAEVMKHEVEMEIMKKRDMYDQQMEEETEAKIREIREKGEKEMSHRLEAERERNRSTIDQLRKDFEKNHTLYAQEIMQKILEV